MKALRLPLAVLFFLALIAGIAMVINPDASSAAGDPVPFTDVKKQTQEFIGYESSITLTPKQEAVKKEALTALPAPCCSDNTAYTCCCPCNMALSIWGLSNLLISEHGYNATQVREKVEEWVTAINPKGFSGEVCYKGGCNRPFDQNGCGGMARGQVTWGDEG